MNASEMKNTNIQWLGKVPAHWQVMPNKYIMSKIKDIRPIYNGEPILSLSQKGVITRDLDNPSGKMPKTFDGYQAVKKGNLLMCLFDIDVTPRCIGLIESNGLCSPAYSQFQLNNFADSKYYYYYLNLDFKKTLLHLAKNLRHSFTEEELGRIWTLVPPVQEQTAIANFLDSKCAEIDALTADIEKQIETLQEYKKSVITEAVTKGLDLNVEMKDSGAWFGVLPNTWQICRLKNYACIKNGKDYKEVFQEEGPIPVYGSGGVFTQSSKPLYTKQSILLGRKGTINKPLFVDQPFWTVDTMYYTEINPTINGKYFYYLCTTIPFGFYQYGSAVPSMTQSDLLNVKFPLPPKSEQEKIAEVLDTTCIQIDATIEEKQKQLGTLSQYKQSLIYEYVTGKKTVPNA